ncbi:Fungal specific transcription factor domain [Ceratobasidium sp. AG-Ba]|nr:Fungal specific transcription factor domain [Ceratobasidium sp. AG-Ba]
MECLGYSYLDNPVRKPRKPRTNRNTSATAPSLEWDQPGRLADESTVMDPTNISSCPGTSAAHNNHNIAENQATDNRWTALPGHPAVYSHFDRLGDHSPLLGPPHSSQFDIPPTVPLRPSSDIVLSTRTQFTNDPPTQSHAQTPLVYPPATPNAMSRLAKANPCETGPLVAQRPLFGQALSILGSSETYQMVSSGPNAIDNQRLPMGFYTETRDESDTEDEDEDAEGVMEAVRPILGLDRDVPSNSLPYILSSYLRLMMRVLFEPMNKVDLTKDFLAQRCTMSDDMRYTVMRVATVADLLDKNVELAPENVSVVTPLENRLCSQLALVRTRLEVRPESYANDVFMAIWHMHELMLMQCFSGSMAFHVRMLHQVVSLYQLAYLENPRAPIRLHSQLYHPNRILRHPLETDIILSLSTCRPMIFEYDTTIQEPEHGTYPLGVQWKSGIPDQFLVMLAQMNTLRQDCAPNIAPGIIDGLEAQIAGFEPSLGRSLESRLFIARMVVQECWRQFMYIYLYMGLCGANSHDTRVGKVLKRFIKVLDRVKPGRMPDAFLVTPMSLAGIAAHTDRDRNIIRQHFRSLSEYFQWGTYVNDAALILETIWATADAENRPAVWSDLRLACEAVTGIV